MLPQNTLRKHWHKHSNIKSPTVYKSFTITLWISDATEVNKVTAFWKIAWVHLGNIIKYHSLGGLCITVLEAEKSKIKVWAYTVPSSMTYFKDNYLLLSPYGRKDREHLVFLIWALHPFMKVLPSRPNPLPQAPGPNTILWGLGFSICFSRGTKTFNP